MTMPDTTTRAREIRAELSERAPFPAWGTPVTALSVAKYLDVQAQILWSRHIVPFTGAEGESLDPQAIMHLSASFAAAHALRILDRIDHDAAQACAAQIADAWNDGGGTGEWIYEHLDHEALKVAVLAEELARVTKPAEQPGVAVDPEDLRAVLGEAEPFIGGKDNAAFTRLAEAAGVS